MGLLSLNGVLTRTKNSPSQYPALEDTQMNDSHSSFFASIGPCRVVWRADSPGFWPSPVG